MSAIIRNKEELSDLVKNNLPKYPVIDKYFSRTIQALIQKQDLQFLLEIPLIRYLATADIPLKNFEKFIQEKSFANIEVPLSRLKSNLDEYHAILSELYAAESLKEEGAKNIKFLSQLQSNPDIEFEENGVKKYAEVKGFMSTNPDFSILNDKFEARSLQDPIFKRTFFISTEYNSHDFSSIERLHKHFKEAVDELTKKLSTEFKKGEVEDYLVKIDKFTFKITTKPSERKDFLLLFSGGLVAYGQLGDVFLQLSSVYTRIISASRDGYLQLLNKRGGDKDLVKKDRLYLFLNVERYGQLIDEVKEIFGKLSTTLGINQIVDLRIVL